MNEQIILKTLCDSYSIKFDHIELLREGGCVAYCVFEGEKQYFMKIIPSAFMETAKHSLDILMYLEDKQFRSPRVIRAIDGLPFTELMDEECVKFAVLFEYVEGQEPNEAEHMERIGALVGQLHKTMSAYHEPLVIREKEFFINRYLKILELKQYDSSKIEKFREYGDWLWKRVENLPRGFCHGDMHSGNLLVNASGELYVFDFDTACHAFPSYDVMMMCNVTNYFDFEDSGYEQSKKMYETFLTGYEKHCTLTEQEHEAFYDLIAIYHYQLQATIIEIYGHDCVDDAFIDRQLMWLMKWREQCEINSKLNQQ